MSRLESIFRLSLLFSVAALLAVQPVHADVKLVSCASSPGGQESFRFRIDYGRSVVFWAHISGLTEAPATVSSESVVWETSRYEPGDGTVAVAARYVLDRLNGQLSVAYYCLDGDWEWCSPSGSLSYCRPIEDKPLF